MVENLQLPDTSPREARLAAMRLLTRREHSCQELSQKLRHKGFDRSLVEEIIAGLQNEGLVSDERFAESFMRSRINKGYGPTRIIHELRQRGVSGQIIAVTVIEDDPEWYELASKVREKRFGKVLPQTMADKARQQRFLQYRGFGQQYLKYAFSKDPELVL